MNEALTDKFQLKAGALKPAERVNGKFLEDNRQHFTIQKKANRAVQLVNRKQEINTPPSNKIIAFKSINNSSQSLQFVHKLKFDEKQRKSILAKNAKKNNGYHTCVHCGFQHKLTTYAKYRGRKLGDGGFHIDHINPVSRGGKANIRNGRVLCGTCNTSRGNRNHINLTGIQKFKGIHQGALLYNYKRLQSSRRRRRK